MNLQTLTLINGKQHKQFNTVLTLVLTLVWPSVSP